MKTFQELGLNSHIQKSLEELGYIEATPIQEEAIPFVLENDQDLIGLAQTGTGKTAAFGLPILNKLKKNKEVQAIILCPTRELCL
ncbi:MAG: DEAD/DEAH box helicase, partial [Patescibacteria group bacterium]